MEWKNEEFEDKEISIQVTNFSNLLDAKDPVAIMSISQENKKIKNKFYNTKWLPFMKAIHALNKKQIHDMIFHSFRFTESKENFCDRFTNGRM